MNKLYALGMCVTGLLVCRTGYGQTGSAEVSVSTNITTLKKQYEQSINLNSRLYNGPEYVFYDKLYRTKQGHQFFNEPELKPGEILYDGQRYSNIPLLYDTHLDQVVSTLPSNAITYRLINEKIQAFTLQNHTFVRLVAPPTPKTPIITGFYDLLFDGNAKLFAKREKSLEKRAEQNSVKIIFLESINYFIYKDNTYYPITSLNNFVSLFPENKASLQKYARTNKLKFNKANREVSLVKLAQYNASLAH
ncbi:hypothetical protein HMJ29_18915 [Hymenobacter taeanensis]|uniref:Uncharacterized protein n=1 Tax=Hymenobacter taeanensis TaxID=2735321 RepID=A0A6M6BM15_9BACT|nr:MULTISPECIES: hypothetical protein [Hymenobacter]QJX48868.1 hypothetical protein HMJ29_18915 [Hymenobacter taeanensis]UOQ81621.1 hypothetical protein MUN83_02140 [Hymenobacter sp. 5414T-23]